MSRVGSGREYNGARAMEIVTSVTFISPDLRCIVPLNRVVVARNADNAPPSPPLPIDRVR